MTIEYTAPSDAKQAPDRQGESGEQAIPSGRSVAGTVIAVLLVFFTLYFATALLVPIAAAVLLSMLLAPAVQLLERVRVPRMLASAVVVLSVVGLLGAGMIALVGPAKIWVERTAQSLQKLEQRFRASTKPIEDIKKATGVEADPPVQEVSGGRTGVGRSLVVCHAPCRWFHALYDHIGLLPARGW